MSHHSVNRFLQREGFSPKDLFMEVAASLILDGGTVSVDDTVLDKPYSNYTVFDGYQYSGKDYKAVKGINLITLYYTDIKGYSFPVNFRIYDSAVGKSKNDYLLEMLKAILVWGLRPVFVAGDSWYSSAANLNTVKNNSLGFQYSGRSHAAMAPQSPPVPA